MVGTGKYRTSEEMIKSLSNSQTEYNCCSQKSKEQSNWRKLTRKIDWQKFWMLPNTAGCKNAMRL